MRNLGRNSSADFCLQETIDRESVRVRPSCYPALSLVLLYDLSDSIDFALTSLTFKVLKRQFANSENGYLRHTAEPPHMTYKCTEDSG